MKARPIHPGRGHLSDWCIGLSICTHLDLIDHIRRLPYGRNADRANYKLVMTEGCGTCSTKHAFVKAVAIEQDWIDVDLILSLFKMNEINVPGSKPTLDKYQLEYIPEAHCYVEFGGAGYDLTKLNSDLSLVHSVEMHRELISPYQIGDYKVDYHKEMMTCWAKKQGLSFEQAWTIREEVIKNLID